MQGEECDNDTFKTCLVRLMSAFPSMGEPFFLECFRMMKAQHYTRYKVVWCTNRIIMEHHYPTITVADLVNPQKKNEEKRVELFSWSWIYKTYKQVPAPGYIAFKQIHGEIYYIREVDLKKFCEKDCDKCEIEDCVFNRS